MPKRKFDDAVRFTRILREIRRRLPGRQARSNDAVQFVLPGRSRWDKAISHGGLCNQPARRYVMIRIRTLRTVPALGFGRYTPQETLGRRHHTGKSPLFALKMSMPTTYLTHIRNRTCTPVGRKVGLRPVA